MTVIAWDGKVLATDGRTTLGTTLVTDKAVKIKEFEHANLGPVRGAFCGAVLIVEPWINHMRERGFAPFELDEDFAEIGCSGIVVTDDGNAYEIATNGLWHRIIRPVAYGSGATIAQHFLLGGSDSLLAVREACKSDLSCGGHILAYDSEVNKYRGYVR